MTDTKRCASCGRAFAWRKKWERNWDNVRYCSAACRKRGVRAVDKALEASIMMRLSATTGSACPSDVARQVAKQQGLDDWRPLQEPARRAARRLFARGLVEIRQNGKAADPDRARGPIRLVLRRPWG